MASLSVCLTVTFVFASGDAFEVDNAEVQPLLQPDAVHNADHLKGQHILPEVFSNLTHKRTERKITPPPILVGFNFSHQGAHWADEKHVNNSLLQQLLM